MALEYALKMQCPAPVEEIRSFVSALDGFSDGGECLVGPGLTGIWIRNETTQRESVNQTFGFQPDVSFLIRLDRDSNSEIGYRAILNMVTELFKKFTGDAVLLYNLDQTALWRKAGVLTIYSQTGLWLVLPSATLTLPHTVDSSEPVVF